ncbi:MAG: hypothetical protein HY052_08400 [Proteobacteria bacterium]|nr:hypothetical protein [Pseudomonadota bacterium]
MTKGKTLRDAFKLVAGVASALLPGGNTDHGYKAAEYLVTKHDAKAKPTPQSP